MLRPDGTPVTIENLLARPGMLLLIHGDDSERVDGLRRTLGDLGTVIRVVNGTAGAGEECVVDPDDAECHEDTRVPALLAAVKVCP